MTQSIEQGPYVLRECGSGQLAQAGEVLEYWLLWSQW